MSVDQVFADAQAWLRRVEAPGERSYLPLALYEGRIQARVYPARDLPLDLGPVRLQTETLDEEESLGHMTHLRVKINRYVLNESNDPSGALFRAFMTGLMGLTLAAERHILVLQFHRMHMYMRDFTPTDDHVRFRRHCGRDALAFRDAPLASVGGHLLFWFSPAGRLLYRCRRDELLYRHLRPHTAGAIAHCAGITLPAFLEHVRALGEAMQLRHPGMFQVVLGDVLTLDMSYVGVADAATRGLARGHDRLAVAAGGGETATPVFHLTAITPGDVIFDHDADHRVEGTLTALVLKYVLDMAQALRADVIMTDCVDVGSPCFYSTKDERERLGLGEEHVFPDRVFVVSRDMAGALGHWTRPSTPSAPEPVPSSSSSRVRIDTVPAPAGAPVLANAPFLYIPHDDCLLRMVTFCTRE